MDRFRFGLAGLGGPLTERALYGEAPGDRLVQYGRRFTCLEAGFTARPEFTGDHAQAVLDRTPYHVHICPRAPDIASTDEARITGWLDAIGPLLTRRPRGPIHVPWRGERNPQAEDRLEGFLACLWPRLPGHQRIAVEFDHPSWFRHDIVHMLEENGAGLVWSTRAGQVPYRVTADFIYVRLTGDQRRVGDEVAALSQRITQRPDDRRPVYVISALHADPYGLKALDRFAVNVDATWRFDPPETAPRGQSSLDQYALAGHR